MTKHSDDRQRALSAVSYVVELIPTMPQLARQVTAYSLVGEILWRYDQDRARECFRLAFATIDRITVDDVAAARDQQARDQQVRDKKHQLRLEVLRRLAPLDRQLERDWIERIMAQDAQAAAGADQRAAQELVDLAAILLENDPDQAVNLAGDSLQHGMSSEFGDFLQKLRQTDPESANQLFDDALRSSSGNQNTSVDALLSLLNFAFPNGVENEGPLNSTVDAEQTGQLLDILASKLSQPDPPPSATRTGQSGSDSSSADLASIIEQNLPLFERYAPENVPALENASHQGSTQKTGSTTNGSSEKAANDSSANGFTGLLDDVLPATDRRTRDRQLAQMAVTAAHHGDPDKAWRLLSRIEDRGIRQGASDMVNSEIALQAIAADDFARARHHVGDISQMKRRAAVSLLAAQKLANQGETGAAVFWLNETYELVAQSSDRQEQLQTLFPLVFAAVRLDSSRAFDMAQFVVTTLNRARSHAQRPRADGLEQSSLQEYVIDTFQELGRLDMDRALYLAMQLDGISARAYAELAVCRVVLADN